MGITIVGLGTGNGRHLTREAWEILTTTPSLFVRTAQHPTLAELAPTVTWQSFDAVYDTAVSFRAVYDQIVTTLLSAGQRDEIVYAVPGHPHVGEATVTKLIAAAEEARVIVHIVPGVSFIEPILTALNVDALDGFQIFDAIALTDFHYPPLNPDVPLLLGQVYNRLLAGEVKEVLTAIYPDEHPVQLIHAAGTESERIEDVPIYAIDHSNHISHLTSLFVPPLPVASSLMALAETVAHLRSPEGCPWDQEQTPQSMRAGFLEEASEVLEALDAGDEISLEEELGDVFYHLLMQTQMASEAGHFMLSDVLAGIETKLKRRHPHVWGDWQVSDSAHVVRNWEMLKREEKEADPVSILDGIPEALPALARAQKIQTRVKQVGFDWPDIEGVYIKLEEELAELMRAQSVTEQAEELGDLLFVLVNIAKWLDIDAESALREANLKFSNRFKLAEQLAAQRNLKMEELDLAALDTLWEEVKTT